MAKASFKLPNGTTVLIEGGPQEVTKILKMFSQPTGESEKKKGLTRVTTQKATPGRGGPQQLILELAKEGYFKGKRVMGDIQKKLEEKGHIYAQESLSPALLRLTRKKTLRRIKEKKGWVYINY
ncbi:MAG: hypothetical protein A2V67_12630 [Deltaproteobacteria bacterium RBG_13_61_14]|nr:MAG: hypothetical protein A2V67_12630 [Deltaproteobacteria bacterium RBG_13_61_14]